MNVHTCCHEYHTRGKSRPFCDGPVCPDPVWKPSKEGCPRKHNNTSDSETTVVTRKRKEEKAPQALSHPA